MKSTSPAQQEKSCLCLKKTLPPTTSWLLPELVSLHTVVSSAVYSPRTHLLLKLTKEPHGSSQVLLTPMHSCMMMNSKLPRRNSLITSVLTTLFHENKKGGKMYIQDKVEEYADEVFKQLDDGAHIYFCGLKGMMPGIQDMLKGVAESKGLDYTEWLKGLKSKKQWH